jgi:mono/diheme cytochrome c family protein
MMRDGRLGRLLGYLGCMVLAALLAACGGGGGGTSTSGDVVPIGPRAPSAAEGLDRFLLFPNPQVRADGVFEVGDASYAKAYYEAIDPTNAKDTLAKWKAANNIGVTTGGHTEYYITVGDQRDLGYGRRMTAHRNPDGTMAFVVDNHLVGAYGGYSPLNLEAAVNQVAQWHLGTNAIEFSPGPDAGTGGRPADGSFAKFYSFDPTTGARLSTISLDGRPAKAMPTVCITCHGGRGDPLTPPDPVTGKQLFPLVMNSYSQHRGDLQGRLHPFEPAAFDYSTIAGYTRAELEPAMKTINKMVLCSFPFPTTGLAPVATVRKNEDVCRREAIRHEYQGTAATHLKAIYGGQTGRVTATDGMPDATSTVDSTRDMYVEPTWATAGQSALYLNVQAESCRVCHLLRGTGNQSDIDFDTFDHFDSNKDRIKAHIADRGNMPLAKLIYDKFWSTVGIFQTMGTYLMTNLTGTISPATGLPYSEGYSDGAMMPGRPIADPGPSRVVKQGATTLSAAMSLYSSSYQWTLTSNPGGRASLTDPSSATPVFNATANGTYVVQLVAGQGSTASVPAALTLVVDNSLLYTPSNLRFADIKAVLQAGLGTCTTCHQNGGNGTLLPPIWYTSYDRAGTGNGADATNDHWFYTELRGRINFTDIVASPLLRKPSGHHHGANLVPGVIPMPGFDTTLVPGDPGRANYDKVLNWILNGAPET